MMLSPALTSVGGCNLHNTRLCRPADVIGMYKYRERADCKVHHTMKERADTHWLCVFDVFIQSRVNQEPWTNGFLYNRGQETRIQKYKHEYC